MMATVPVVNLVPPSPWLSRDELLELAGVPAEQGAAARIRRWLKRNHIPYLSAVNGWPQVSRLKVRQALGEEMAGPSQGELTLEPNFDALN
ncbi:protein of unknown function [Andreprevotia lacus DSM 23236]|jgi:hypothetical protein|uniref:DUF4224 domain-containing protein n=1 Tax=Andreprevotia lacus DSM 23236 TaxID=1121001 RepID=A0A1W1XL88_9NEIS|nr:DUF4224 domain-containing protein [Andreprevotia lacus]SMC24278.1 protein of unknown function [Andreprevotia lacus DSM 23236]